MKLPRLTPRWSLALFGLLLGIGLLVPMPATHRAAASMIDSMHGPAFAVLAFLACRVLIRRSWLGSRRAAWVTCAALIALGAATEVAQGCVGREFSVKDIAANSLGIVAGALWAVAAADPAKWSPRALRAWAVGLLAVAMVFLPLNLIDTAIQYRDFPVLGSFEQPLERLRWRVFQADVGRSRQHVTDGRWSLRVDLLPGKSSGLGMEKPIPDWSKYTQLVFDLYVAEGPPLDWYVLIEDRPSRKTSDDRFEKRFRILPGRQRIVIPLTDVERGPRGRRLDLGRISWLHLFTVGSDTPRTLFLDNLRLR